MTRLGYQIPNFTYPDTRPADICASSTPSRNIASDSDAIVPRSR